MPILPHSPGFAVNLDIALVLYSFLTLASLGFPLHISNGEAARAPFSRVTKTDKNLSMNHECAERAVKCDAFRNL